MPVFSKKDKEEQKKHSEKDTVLDAPAKQVKTKEDTGRAHEVLVRPIVSEKAYAGAKVGKYIFLVNKEANKIEIRKAVEKVYDVKVDHVNVINIKGKERNFGRTKGRTSDFKKAIVTLKPGQIIGEAQV